MQRINDQTQIDQTRIDHGQIDQTRIDHSRTDRTQIDPELETDSVSGLEIDPEDLRPRRWDPPKRSRVLLVLALLAAIALMIVLPPLIKVDRYRRQIAGSIGASLGRPVRMGSVTLNILPLPGFTLKDFEVGEDPEFGWEPVIKARSVTVTLRVLPLWRRRVEFSRISLEDASVNLVHRSDGRWNVESILLQASRIRVAPTGQKSAGYAPRFPYIEATNARVNVKMGLEKMPLALTETEFALWLPQPDQWRVRMEGKPARTDAAATDTGLIRIQGTLGKAATLRAVPIDLMGEWRTAPLGGVSLVLVGHDAGLRGEMTLHTEFRGTVGDNAVESRLRLSDVRRADFVPERTLSADVSCQARSASVFHTLHAVDCDWLTGDTLHGQPAGVHVEGDVPDLLHPSSARFHLTGLMPASFFVDALHAASSRVSPALSADGSVAGTLICCAPASPADGSFEALDARLALGDGKPLLDGPIGGQWQGGVLNVGPIALNLGGNQPASLTARLDRNGYQLHLNGSLLRSRLARMQTAFPQFGDGLDEALAPLKPESPAAPLRVDLQANRAWGEAQTWTEAAPAKPAHPKKRSRR
jgi:AsmA protein